jgi:hypothetical protein
MALQFKYELDSGIELPAAYVHIRSFQGNKSSIEVQIAIFKDQLAREQGKQPIDLLNKRIEVVDGATFSEMYTELKKQDPFKEAVDI